MSVRLIPGDCLRAMRLMMALGIQVDSIVCDPPYHLTSIVKRFGAENAAPVKAGKTGAYKRASTGFMGKHWDGGDIAFQAETWALALAVLKPGGHLLAFGGTRGWHRMAVAIEDAGFEIRDTLAWIFGSGFPKSHNLTGKVEGFDGWGTALKPAFEPIVLARKPLGEKSVAANVLAHGTGAINVGACRVDYKDAVDQASAIPQGRATAKSGALAGGTQNNNDRAEFQARNDEGRWPANVCHDGGAEVEAAFAAFDGGRSSGLYPSKSHGTGNGVTYAGKKPQGQLYADSGSAARFFYSAKAGPEDRFGSKHPTVKPVALIRWLQRLVTPPGGLTLDPFAGSGTAGVAAIAEGFRAILIEAEPEYQADIRERLAWATGDGRHALAAKARNASPEKTGHVDLPLFASPESAE